MNVLILSLTTARAAQVVADVQQLLADGHQVHLVVTKGKDWEDVDPRVAVHALSDVEGRHPILRIERFLVLVLPRLVYSLVARLLAVVARLLPGPFGRRVQRLGGAWKRRWIVVREASRRFHRERWGRVYGAIRPWILWRVARRSVLPDLKGPWEIIVVADALATPIGWKLARRWPEAAVGFSLDEALAELRA